MLVVEEQLLFIDWPTVAIAIAILILAERRLLGVTLVRIGGPQKGGPQLGQLLEHLEESVKLL